MVVGSGAVGGHGADDGGVGGADVHDEAGEAGRHADGLGHVEGLLGVVAVAAGSSVDAGGAGAVGGEQRDGDVVGLADVGEVGVEVGQVGAVVLEQAEVLAGAGEGGPRRSRRRACRCRGTRPTGRSRWWRGRRRLWRRCRGPAA